MAELNYSEQLKHGILSARDGIIPDTTLADVALVKKSLATEQRVVAEEALHESRSRVTEATQTADRMLKAKLFANNVEKFSAGFAHSSNHVVLTMGSTVASVKATFEALGKLNNSISGYWHNAQHQTTEKRALDANNATNDAFSAANRLLSASVDANVAASRNKSDEVHTGSTAIQLSVEGMNSSADDYQKVAVSTAHSAVTQYDKTLTTESAAIETYRSAKANAAGVLTGLARLNSLLNGNLMGTTWQPGGQHGNEFSEGIVATVEPPNKIYLPPGVNPPAQSSGTSSDRTQSSEPLNGVDDKIIANQSSHNSASDLQQISASISVQSVWFVATKLSAYNSFDYTKFLQSYENQKHKNGKELVFRGSKVSGKWQKTLLIDTDGKQIKLGHQYVVFAFYSPYDQELPAGPSLAYNTYLSLPSLPVTYQYELLFVRVREHDHEQQDAAPIISPVGDVHVSQDRTTGEPLVLPSADFVLTFDWVAEIYADHYAEGITYRIFIIQNEVQKSLSHDNELYLAELKSPVNYTQVSADELLSGVKYTLNPPSATRSYTDMYGQFLQSGVEYVAFLMAVESDSDNTITTGLPSYKSILSAPSAPFVPGEPVLV